MFDIGFSEVLLIFVIALVVLGPEKLPRLASQVGRWIGRARAMARQFREQLEEEVNLEQVRKAHEKPQKPAAWQTDTQADQSQGQQAQPTASNTDTSSSGTATPSTGVAGDPYATEQHGATQAHPSGTSTTAASTGGTIGAYHGPDPADFRADTFSHAHPTNEYGANPHTSNGAAEEPSPTVPAHDPAAASVPSEADVTTAQPPPEPDTERRTGSSEAYAARRPRDNSPGTDNHGN
jgi:sec-independent protein translocase protein TatB